jgi:uncharacterized damage-inducible protein DinB
MVPTASSPAFQHLVDTYASEIEKTASVWRAFSNGDLDWRPHPKSFSVGDIMKHQLLSERRFFAEFIGLPEIAAVDVLPQAQTVEAFVERLLQQSNTRLHNLAATTEQVWLTPVKFFDVERERIWVFWRRVLHTAHHRTQLTVNLRLMEKPVPSTYGPTADVTWSGADPTNTVEAAGRK